MYPFACEGVEEYGECGHECLTLTGGHLGDIIADGAAIHHAVKHHASYELHIVVHHIPSHLVASGDPCVFIEGLVAVDAYEVLACGCEFAVGL